MPGSETIHIAHVTGSTGLYGAEHWILAQMRYLEPRRWRASIVNLVDKSGEKSAIVCEATRRGFTALDFYTGGRFNPLAVFRLARLVQETGYNILHSHGYKSDIMAFLAGKLAGVKVIGTPHGWSRESSKKELLYEKLDRAFLRFFDRLCPLSPELCNSLRMTGINESKINLVMNGVDLKEVDEASPRPKGSGKKRIGFIGQFIERKRVEDLVEAFFLLSRPDCELFLIGDGPCRASILNRVRLRNGHSEIHCSGHVLSRLEHLKSFDVFALPSLLEGIPRSIMEAHAARVPVIGTDIAGIRDLVKHEQTGLLVPPKNPPMLAEAINRILESPQLAAKLAAGGRKLVDEQFSASRMAEQYETVYFSAVNQAIDEVSQRPLS
ncbi:MAG: glycosyltransferase family 4 protein [Deltaproteobacteria bacterium]|nr:glycosyltransferase family 4 protein [Deltaproteobacteria bacterium]